MAKRYEHLYIYAAENGFKVQRSTPGSDYYNSTESVFTTPEQVVQYVTDNMPAAIEKKPTPKTDITAADLD